MKKGTCIESTNYLGYEGSRCVEDKIIAELNEKVTCEWKVFSLHQDPKSLLKVVILEAVKC